MKPSHDEMIVEKSVREQREFLYGFKKICDTICIAIGKVCPDHE